MNPKIKNYLGIAGIIAVLLLAFSAWQYADYFGRSIQPASFRSFAVTGEGKATVIPDVALFTFSVVTQGGKNLADLQQTNTKSANAVINYVKSSGVADKDIKTVNYSVDPRYDSYNCNTYLTSPNTYCPPPSIVGYTVTNTVQVKARDFGKVGDILTGVVQNGANDVSSLSFTLDDPASAEIQARAEAIVKAKAKAEAVARAGEFGLGKILSIDEGYSPRPVYYSAVADKAGAGTAPAAPSVEPGSQDVNVSVTIRYEIR